MGSDAYGNAWIAAELAEDDEEGLREAICKCTEENDFVSWNDDGSVAIEWDQTRRDYDFYQPLVDWLKDAPRSLFRIHIEDDEGLDFQLGGTVQERMPSFISGAKFLYELENAVREKAGKLLSGRVLTNGESSEILPYGYDRKNDPDGIVDSFGEGEIVKDVSFDDGGKIGYVCMRILSGGSDDIKLERLIDLLPDERVKVMADGVARLLTDSPKPEGNAGLAYDLAKAGIGGARLGPSDDGSAVYLFIEPAKEMKKRHKDKGERP